MENWKKEIHVASSLVPKDIQYALFIGRWQPLHSSHKALFNQALNEGKKVCIAHPNTTAYHASLYGRKPHRSPAPIADRTAQ